MRSPLRNLLGLSVCATGVVLSIATSPPIGPSLRGEADGPALTLDEPAEVARFRVQVAPNEAAFAEGRDVSFNFAEVLGTLTAHLANAPAPAPDAGPGSDGAPIDEARALRVRIEAEGEDTGADAGASVFNESLVLPGSDETFGTSLGAARQCPSAEECTRSFVVTFTAPEALEPGDSLEITWQAAAELVYEYESEGDNQLPDGAELSVTVEALDG